MVENEIVHTEDLHCEMPLPFKYRSIKLPKKPTQCKNSLDCLKKRLQSDEKYCEDYCNFMSEIISKGYARKVAGDIKPVFDCSARYQGQSLNENLLPGQDLASNLLGVLTRFCQGKFAFTADIEKMFYQVRVKRDDQNFFKGSCGGLKEN